VLGSPIPKGLSFRSVDEQRGTEVWNAYMARDGSRSDVDWDALRIKLSAASPGYMPASVLVRPQFGATRHVDLRMTREAGPDTGSVSIRAHVTGGGAYSGRLALKVGLLPVLGEFKDGNLRRHVSAPAGEQWVSARGIGARQVFLDPAVEPVSVEVHAGLSSSVEVHVRFGQIRLAVKQPDGTSVTGYDVGLMSKGVFHGWQVMWDLKAASEAENLGGEALLVLPPGRTQLWIRLKGSGGSINTMDVPDGGQPLVVDVTLDPSLERRLNPAEREK